MWQVFSTLRFILFRHYQKDSKKDFVLYTGMLLTTLRSVFLENGPDLHQNLLFSKIRDVHVSDGKSVAPTCFVLVSLLLSAHLSAVPQIAQILQFCTS